MTSLPQWLPLLLCLAFVLGFLAIRDEALALVRAPAAPSRSSSTTFRVPSLAAPLCNRADRRRHQPVHRNPARSKLPDPSVSRAPPGPPEEALADNLLRVLTRPILALWQGADAIRAGGGSVAILAGERESVARVIAGIGQRAPHTAALVDVEALRRALQAIDESEVADALLDSVPPDTIPVVLCMEDLLALTYLVPAETIQ